MAIQLNPSKVPIWKSENELQLGLEREAQKLLDVSNSQERLINLLFQGVAEEQIDLMGASVGLSEIETTEFVERLRPSLLAEGDSIRSGTSFDLRFAEIIRIGFETNETPESVLAKRSNTLLHLPKLDRTGLLTIKTLAEAGFRNFETTDYEFVTRHDCGELGFQAHLLGTSRLAATRTALEGHSFKIDLRHPDRSAKNRERITLVSAMYRINPKNYRDLSEPFVAIEYGIETLRISPVIIPNKTPCLSCRDHWEAEDDADWIGTAIQLAARNDQLDDGPGLLLAVAIAAKTICTQVDNRRGATTTGFEIDLRTRTLRPSSWQFHPQCDCQKPRQKPGR